MNLPRASASAPVSGDRARSALVTAVSVVAFGIAPVAALLLMLEVGLDTGTLADDFHHELYPQAKEMLAGRNPYPPPDFELTPKNPFVWPPAAAFLVAPLTALSVDAASVGIAVLGLVCMAAALWIVGLRDWRVYGLTAMWPQVAGEMRVSHLTPVLMLLLALAWRSRRSWSVAGLAIGFAIAIKLFVWPLLVWLVAIRRARAAALAVVLAGALLLLVVPYAPLDDYLRSLIRLGRFFDQDAYTLFALLAQLGTGDAAARAVTVAVGAALLIATWRLRSFTLAIAAALMLSPIVWLDYFALTALPLAVGRPRLSWVWALPLLTWGATGAGYGIGEPSDIARVLVVFGAVLAVALRDERGAHRPSTSPAFAR